MKATVLLVFSLVFIFSSHKASAECANVIVEEIYINATGDIYVATSGTETNLSCTTVSGGGTHITLKNIGNFNAILSALLATQRAGRPIDIRVDTGAGNQEGCNILYIKSKP